MSKSEQGLSKICVFGHAKFSGSSFFGDKVELKCQNACNFFFQKSTLWLLNFMYLYKVLSLNFSVLWNPHPNITVYFKCHAKNVTLGTFLTPLNAIKSQRMQILAWNFAAILTLTVHIFWHKIIIEKPLWVCCRSV